MAWLETSSEDGRLTNVLATHDSNRASAEAHLALYRAVMYGDSGLSRGEREAVALCVSTLNDCGYSLADHGAHLSAETGDDRLERNIRYGELDELPERIRLLCAYAVKLTATPWRLKKSDLDSLRAIGLSDREIVDANQVVAYFNYAIRIVRGLGVELEPGPGASEDEEVAA